MPIAPIWAFGAIIIWQCIAMLAASLGSADWRMEFFLLGYLLATPIIYRLDKRIIQQATKRSWLTTPKSWILLALIAGIGFTIVGSELGNVGQKMTAANLPFKEPNVQTDSPLTAVILGSVVYPITFILVLVGVSLRSLLTWINPWGAMVLTAGLAAFGAPMSHVIQLAFVAALPIWLYARTGSLVLSIVSYLPATSLPLVNLLGWAPGIVGFDAVGTGLAQQQPVWFTLMGALAILAGLGRILYRLSPPESAS